LPKFWNLTGGWICLIHQICLPKVGYIQPKTSAKVLDSDENIRLGWIYPL
jgi:hypothetical protein